MVENIQLDSLNFHSAEHIHYVSEVERRVYSDRAEFLGDIDFIPVPIETLISDNYSDGFGGGIFISLSSIEIKKSSVW